ncbi:DUF6615 family protein [Glaciihabitans sp. UYNi722]|uniref:DUF6615 family protein n=1 Tax=Glaciihabitans sp. UYNi722 TaxID=3156344 RepID=UPI003398FB7E
MRLNDLTNLMDELSHQTWFNLTAARRLNMRMGEVTITEVNLLAIARLIDRTGVNVELIATRSDEKTTGTDFEIWVKLRSGRVLGFAVQAKIIYVHDGKYEYSSLGHGNKNGAQMKLLEAHAARRGAQPVHVFFNGWDTSDSKAPPTPRGKSAELYGCAAIMTPVVRRVRTGIGYRKGVNRAAPYLKVSIPWSELFLIPDVPADADGGDSGSDGDAQVRGGGPGGEELPASGDTPLRPIDFTDRDFDALEARLSQLRGDDSEPRRAAELPSYITRFRGVPREQITDDDDNFDAPPFALLIEESDDDNV